MTEQEQKAFDQMRQKIEKALIYLAHSGKFSRSGAKDVLNEALTAANAVSEQQFCYCNPDVSLQMVSGGGAPEGYLGRVTLRIGDQYRDYHSHPQATEPASCHQTGVCVRSGLAAENHARLIECARRLVEHADFALGGILSADSKAKDIPSKAVSQVKSRHLAALRDALPAAPEAKQ